MDGAWSLPGTPDGPIPLAGTQAYRDRMLRALVLEGARRIRDERGAVATEYGLILTLVVLVTVIAITAFGIAVVGLFDRGVAAF